MRRLARELGLLGVEELTLVLPQPPAGGAVPAGHLLPLLLRLLRSLLSLMDLLLVFLQSFCFGVPLLALLTDTLSLFVLYDFLMAFKDFLAAVTSVQDSVELFPVGLYVLLLTL